MDLTTLFCAGKVIALVQTKVSYRARRNHIDTFGGVNKCGRPFCEALEVAEAQQLCLRSEFIRLITGSIREI